MSTLQYIKHKNFILYINKRGKLVRAFSSYDELCSLLKTKVLPAILYVPAVNDELVERLYFLGTGAIPDYRHLTKDTIESGLKVTFEVPTEDMNESILLAHLQIANKLALVP